jgi:hypothetical protein
MFAKAAPFLVAAALVASGCGGGTTTPITTGLRAVNGANYAAVFAGDTATWAGFGLGAEQGDAAVLVRGPDGDTPVEIVSWSDGGIRGVLPAGLVTGPTWIQGATGDSLGLLDLFARQRTSYDPTAHEWAETPTLPVEVADVAAAGLRFPSTSGIASLVLLFGGRRADGSLSNETYIGVASSDGRLTEWRAASDTIIPAGRRFHAMAGADRTTAVLDIESVAFMAGGLDATGQPITDVDGIGLDHTGAYSLWTSLASLPKSTAGAAAATTFGTLYLIGGFGPDSLASTQVFYAPIRPEGTLNGWLQGPPLPEGRAFASMAVAGSMLLTIGGQRGLIAPDSGADSTQLAGTVFAIRLSPLTGAFVDTAWTELPDLLLHPRARHAAFVVGDALVVTGGVYPGMPSTGETEVAQLVDDRPGAFAEWTGAPLPAGAVWGAAAPIVWDIGGVPHVTLIGGSLGGTPTARTWTH